MRGRIFHKPEAVSERMALSLRAFVSLVVPRVLGTLPCIIASPLCSFSLGCVFRCASLKPVLGS
jgi:hypothetical protein